MLHWPLNIKKAHKHASKESRESFVPAVLLDLPEDNPLSHQPSHSVNHPKALLTKAPKKLKAKTQKGKPTSNRQRGAEGITEECGV